MTERKCSLPIFVIACFMVLCRLSKTTPSRMHHAFSIRNLFHLPMWVLLVCSWVQCGPSTPPIETDGVTLPTSFQEVNWMEVLETMPLDSGRNVTLLHLQEAHPGFWKAWSEEVLQLGPSDDTLTVDMTLRFLEEMAPMMAAIDTTSGEEGHLAQQSEQLQEALKRHLVLFPDAEVPDVVWMPSGFNFALYPTPEWVGIGLDWFMEPNHPLHQELPSHRFPRYRLQRMRSAWMATDALRGWLLVQHQNRIPSSPRTVDMLLFWGQIMELTSICFPHTSPAQLMNWSEEEWTWAEANERSIWSEVQPQSVMFNKQPREVMRWFQEGPFTRAEGLPQSCPDRLGVYLGWKMVQARRGNHAASDMASWWTPTDPNPFLRAYRP